MEKILLEINAGTLEKEIKDAQSSFLAVTEDCEYTSRPFNMLAIVKE